MSRVIVHIETDHDDDDEAARSVANGMRRAGYTVLNAMVPEDAVTSSAVVETAHEFVRYADPVFVTVQEPEVGM